MVLTLRVFVGTTVTTVRLQGGAAGAGASIPAVPLPHCAGDKGLDGCYNCSEAADCQKGYFGAEDGYTAKGAALYISRHGKEAYAKALSKDVEHPEGISTPEKLVEFFESISV